VVNGDVECCMTLWALCLVLIVDFVAVHALFHDHVFTFFVTVNVSLSFCQMVLFCI
jgi:hypothetical protein